MVDWLLALKPGEPAIVESKVPDEAEGAGLTEAPRGAVGHWMSIKDKKTSRYQVITPTAWNASPKDDKDQPGAVEQAMMFHRLPPETRARHVARVMQESEKSFSHEATARHYFELYETMLARPLVRRAGC